MPDRIVIHIGVHKTATTALQSFFQQKSSDFLASGVRYYSLKEMRQSLTPLFLSAETEAAEKLDTVIENCGCPTVFMSDENIVGAAADIRRGKLYPKSGERLLRFAGRHRDKKLTLVIVLRDPASLVPSLYCEYLRHNPFISFEDYVADFDMGRISFREIFSWTRALPKGVEVLFLPFEPTYGGGAEVIGKRIAGLFSESGLSLDVELGSDRPRSSYSQEELDTAAIIADRSSGNVAKNFLNMLDRKQLRFGNSKFSPIDPALARRMSEIYVEDVEQLCGCSVPI